MVVHRKKIKFHSPIFILHHIFINIELMKTFHWKFHWKTHCSEKFCENFTGCVDLSEKFIVSPADHRLEKTNLHENTISQKYVY